MFARIAKLGLLEDDDVDVACGASYMFPITGLAWSKAIVQCDRTAIFGGAARLVQRVYPSPLPPEWWASSCAELAVESVRLNMAFGIFGSCLKYLDRAELESAPWLAPALETAVSLVKVNASAGLSARSTMNVVVVKDALQAVEAAARVQSHAAALVESGVVEALDFACLNDFSGFGCSVASSAAGAVVELLGRNEGGKTLSPATVNAVLGDFAQSVDPASYRYIASPTRLLPYARRVATMAVADANKKIMLQHDKLLGTLVAGLLLDDHNPRRGQDGADAMQEGCAGVLHELALYGPGASALRSHKPTMDALRALADVGTKESR